MGLAVFQAGSKRHCDARQSKLASINELPVGRVDSISKSLTFSSASHFLSCREDFGFWWRHVASLLERHNVEVDPTGAFAGQGGTFPTLICGDIVVKLFGYLPFWKRAFTAELEALTCVCSDPRVMAPNLVAQGVLIDDTVSPWRYLMMKRIRGTAWGNAALSLEEKAAIAADLGRQVRHLRALASINRVATSEMWRTPGMAEAARRTVLPPHLAAQSDKFVNRHCGSGQVFVHGDLMFRHVYTKEGRLTGIIDWGDALVADPHYELAQLHLNLFDIDKSLLRTFLNHSDWPVGRDFACRALAQAFFRQAVGLAQHCSMDVFYKLPTLLPLEEIPTLDELAEAVFGV